MSRIYAQALMEVFRPVRIKYDNVEIEVTMDELKDPDVKRWVEGLMSIWTKRLPGRT